MKSSFKILIVFLAFYPPINVLAQNNQFPATGSSIIYPDSLKVTNEMSVSDFLQGRVSGLDIIAASGDPGRNAEMILRGLSNSGINSPLIVIDGIPWWPPERFNIGFYLISKEPRCIIPLTLKDIASIEVLKDGTSASIYGAEGANGVILIETKKGGPQKMQLSYQFNQSVTEEPSFMPMLNGDEYIMYQLEAWHNKDGVFDIPPEIAYDRDYPGFYNYSANTDWIKAVTQMGTASNHFLNITGGNEKSHYYGSINYLDQKGTLINSGYKRLLGRFLYERFLTDRLTFSIQLSNAYNKYDGNVSLNDRNILEMAFIKAPNMSIWEYDSLGNRTGDYFVPDQNYQGNAQAYYNPVAVSQLGKSGNTQNDFMTTGRLQYALNEWLRFTESFTYLRSSAAYETYLSRGAVFKDLFSPTIPYINNHLDQIFHQYRNEIQALFKIPFKNENRNSLNGTVSWIRQDMKNDIDYDLYKADLNRNSAASSIMYRLMNRYILNVQTRIESSFNDRDSWDKHLGFTAGWRFSDEPLLKGLHLPEGMIHSGLSYAIYQPFGFYQTAISWPESEIQAQTYNLGIQLGSFNNRIRFSADYYSKLYNQEVTESGSVTELNTKSNGWEFMIDYYIIKTRNVTWEVNYNMAHNNSSGLETSNWGMLTNGRYLGSAEENETMGSIYGLIYEGLYATDEETIARDRDGNIIYNNLDEPGIIRYDYYGVHQNFQAGDVKYKDINYDGIINEEDAVYLGNSYPKYTGGFGSTLKYKNLSLTCNFHFRSAYKVMRQAELESEGMVSFFNQSKEVLNRWRAEGNAGMDLNHRAFRDHPCNNLGSDRYIEDGSFVRMNYVSLGYDFSPKVCQYLHLSEISLSLSAQRLFTISGYDGIDPEIEMESYAWHRDVIRAYPPKVFTFSIQVVL